MDENKIVTNETQEEIKPAKKLDFKKLLKAFKSKKLKNQFLLKRGGYAVAITALAVAAIIVLNVLVSALAKRVDLEFDMTKEKTNSISQENVDYLKSIKDKVDIIVCSTEDTYATNMAYYAQNQGITVSDTAYFDQTVDLIKKYKRYNKNISITFYDTQSSEFANIASKYSSLGLSYGDIIVTATDGENERTKNITFSDIYASEDTSGMGYSMSITGNKIESALTGAISYVLSSEEKKALLIAGHSVSDNTAAYTELLEANNYSVEVSSDGVVNKISDEFNFIAILSPAKDFAEQELVAISEFLENGGKLGKGLMYFADATCPYLPNLSGFLAEWGIEVGEGILFETDDRYYTTEGPTAVISAPSTDADLAGISVCLTSYNVPLSVKKTDSVSASALVSTYTESVVPAPIGASEEFSDYTEDDLSSFATVIKSQKTEYDDDGKELKSTVIAFSSVQYIESDKAEDTTLSNKNLVLKCTDTAAGITASGASFVPKTISEETFSNSVSEAESNLINVIFTILFPIVMIILGIVVFVRRRNAE